MTPGFFGTAIYQVNTTVSGLLAYSINDSAGTLLFYANRLMELPIGVFAIAVSTVVYPLIARHAVTQNFTSMADDFRKGLRLILIINVPAAVGLALLSGPIVRLLYQHGKFTAEDSHAMTPLLALFVVGLPFFSMVNLIVRAFYALKDTATPVKVAVVDFLVNLVLSISLMHWLGAIGLVIASTTAIIVQMVLLQRALARRLPGMTLAPLWPSVAKVMLGALVMGVVVWAGWQLVGNISADIRFHVSKVHLKVHVADLIAVLGLIPLGVAVYGVVLWLVKIEGHAEFSTLLGKLRTKFLRTS
jgi:putative peptidoglycan lipid II flippase